MSGEQPDVRALLRRLADLPEPELQALLQLVQQAAPPDSGENVLIGEPIILDVQLSAVLLHTPPGAEVSDSAASLWEAIRPRTPEQGIAYLAEVRKLLQAILVFLAAATAVAGVQTGDRDGQTPAPSGTQSSLDQPREKPSR